ncbi:MAG: hypothetical protein EBT06_10235 [Gammaproteobacteria bacterium]|nr:hypothetical protein [Gammaproteobacteria bacterium]NBT45279.1 hypothetical protein [Gammaproteobacteria bacterium]NBY23894.1 hypothetical protein [Gammaproteobacteria bacterium]
MGYHDNLYYRWSFILMSYPQRTINRSVVIVRPKQPFLDWLSSVEKALGGRVSQIDLTEEGAAFLIPDEDIIDAKEARRYIEKKWREIFEQFLFDWFIDDTLWPKKRTLKMFREWFDLIYAPMAWDLVKKPLEIDEWDDMDVEPAQGLH